MQLFSNTKGKKIGQKSYFSFPKAILTDFIGQIGLAGIFSLGVLFLLGGCSNLKPQKKDLAAAEKFSFETTDGKPKLIGDYTVVGNYYPVKVYGYGLIKRLPGTGSDDVNTVERRMVYEEMSRLGVRDIRSILADPTTAVVNIQAYLPPGIQEGEHFDAQICLPAETATKSLRGGWLMATRLEEMAYLGGGLKEGNTLALAGGPVMINDPLATETTNPAGLKQGLILGGVQTKSSRFLTLNMKTGAESAFIADRIAKEINHRFYISTGQKKGMATAKTDALIFLDVHPTYVKDVARYVRVVQAIACYETPAKQLRRIETLKEELHSPEKAQQAAFQLEAIGKKGIPALRSALNSPHAEIRFHAATSLAYLDDGTPAKILVNIAQNEPAFRVYALNALSVLRTDIEAEIGLQELLHVPSAETRYGAFRALYNRNPYDRTIRGENLNDQFYYHGITTTGQPMIHLTKSKRPEIVFFGTEIRLNQPFALEAGPVIFINGQTPGTVVVKKFALSGIDEQRAVSNQLDAVIRAVVELGGTYPDVFQMLCQANQMKVLPCRLEIDCLPEPNRVYRRPGTPENDETEKVAERESLQKTTLWNRLNPKTWFETNPGGDSSDYNGTPNTSIRE